MNKEFLEKDIFISAMFSDPRGLKKDLFKKASIRLFQSSKTRAVLYHVTEYRQQQVFHKNLTRDECEEYIEKILVPHFKQGVAHTTERDYHFFMKDPNAIKLIYKTASKVQQDLGHNRARKSILQAGIPIDFLQALGVMDEVGNVFAKKARKFRQINHFLEIVKDVLPEFRKQDCIRILDLGCGKAYLTFALYYFLHIMKGYVVEIVGLDLKEEVLRTCNHLAQTLHYTGLSFRAGNIADECTLEAIDMVVSLHACNTATDYALANAVQRRAKVILVAPCCQQELFHQITSTHLSALLDYGLLRERFSALVTDTARAKILEIMGYQVQLLDFIDPEHTPKNLLLKAVRGLSEQKRLRSEESYMLFKQNLGILPTLEKLLLS